MKTIQINEFTTKMEKKKLEKLLRELYINFLQDDESFYFLFEPELIIRTENKGKISLIAKYLGERKYLYEIYSYPKARNKWHYDESSKVILKYLNTFNKLFHEISLLYLSLFSMPEEKAEFRERIIHILYNMDGFDYYSEARALANHALNRAIIFGSIISNTT